MTHLIPTPVTDQAAWNAITRSLPYAHILQSWEWGEFKRTTTGWQPERIAFLRDGQPIAAASILTRTIGPFAVMYVPKGPALAYEDAVLAAAVLDHLQHLARKRRAVWLKIDPDVIAATGIPGEPDDQLSPIGQAVITALKSRGWRFSEDQVQFRNSLVVDLTRTEDEILAAMSQNTRRKVRTGEKKGVSVRSAALADLPLLYDLYRVTGERDNFLIRPFSYYQQAWREFMQAGLAHALIAEADGKAIAHVILFHYGRTCWYFYGASANEERERMPNYLLQWEAMRWAKAQGYQRYDMWGAPDDFVETDSMWGVFQFKQGFRGIVTRHIGAWDFVPSSFLYTAYTRLWPTILNVLRSRRKN